VGRRRGYVRSVTARGQDDDLTAALARFSVAQGQRRDELESLVRTARSHLGVGAVRVSRRGIWGFGRLESAQFVVGGHSYQVTMLGGQVVTAIAAAVGGVGLAPQPVARAEWVRRLVEEINTVIQPDP
jgi:hypothetical protein